MRKDPLIDNQYYHIYNRGVDKRDVFMDENEGGYYGTVDLGIGRIPARTIEEAEKFLERAGQYSSTRKDDHYMHESHARNLADKIEELVLATEKRVKR